MSTVPGKRIQAFCEQVNDAVANAAGQVQKEGFTADQVFAVTLTSLSAISASALTCKIQAQGGGLMDFLSGLQLFAQQMANHGLPQHQKPSTPDGRPLQ